MLFVLFCFVFYTQTFKLPGIFFFQSSKQADTFMFNLYIWYLNVHLSKKNNNKKYWNKETQN